MRTGAKKIQVLADKIDVSWINAKQVTVSGSDLADLIKKVDLMQKRIVALEAKVGGNGGGGGSGGKPKPGNTKIIAGKLTEGLNMHALPKNWDFESGAKGKDSKVRPCVVHVCAFNLVRGLF